MRLEKEIDLMVQSLTVFMLAHGCDTCPVRDRCRPRVVGKFRDDPKAGTIEECAGILYNALEEYSMSGHL